MRKFLAKHAATTTGTLSCFDRLLFKGHLPLGYPHAMARTHRSSWGATEGVAADGRGYCGCGLAVNKKLSVLPGSVPGWVAVAP